MIEGYNISLSLNSKLLLGRTQDDLSISAKTKESQTKDDQGETNEVVTGHEITLKMAAYMSVNAAGATEKLDRNDVLEMALAKGSQAKYPFVYGGTGVDSYQGQAIITGYSESTDAAADSDNVINLDLKVIGTMTKVTTPSASE